MALFFLIFINLFLGFINVAFSDYMFFFGFLFLFEGSLVLYLLGRAGYDNLNLILLFFFLWGVLTLRAASTHIVLLFLCILAPPLIHAFVAKAQVPRQ